MPISGSRFRPAWWLPGPHTQTLWPALFRRRLSLQLVEKRLELVDGDFLGLAWLGDKGPTVLMLHGLEGSLASHYTTGLMAKLECAGYRVLFMHFRGCSGVPNRLDRSYHSGDTGDLKQVIRYVKHETGTPPYAAIGFSLGGNVLLKWLGEEGTAAPIEAAVAVSVPYVLNNCALRLEKGFSRLYQRHLIRRLQRRYHAKFQTRRSPLTVDVDTLQTFRAFDDQVTAPCMDSGTWMITMGNPAVASTWERSKNPPCCSTQWMIHSCPV